MNDRIPGGARTPSLRAVADDAFLLVGFIAIAGIGSLLLGQDANWDQQNYHYYDARTDHELGSSLGPAISAVMACRAGDADRGYEHFLRTARAEHRESGRVAILRGDVARLQGDPALAVQNYRKVVRRSFHLLPLVLPRLAEAARQAGDPAAFDETLRELLTNGLGNRSEIAYAAIVSGYYDDPVILECVRELIVTDSDLRDLVSALMPAGTEPDEAQLRSIATALRNVVVRHARYRCSVCGIDSSTFLWQCPGCKSWDTQRAIAALEFLPRAARPGAGGD